MNNCFISGIVFAKLIIPKRMKAFVEYSNCAVVNNEVLHYHRENNQERTEEYIKGEPCIHFRFINTREKSTFCDSKFTLLF